MQVNDVTATRQDIVVSLVVPCYNEEKCIRPFYDSLKRIALPCVLEFYFVDDGSKDGTLAECRKLAHEDPSVHYLSFSRNFGKEAGLLAGLQHAKGDFVVTMDVDLQHPPALLQEMFRAVTEEDYESAAAYRQNRRGEPVLRSWISSRFYKVLNAFAEIHLQESATDYRIMSRRFASAVLSLSEVNRFTKGIYAWVGFNTKWIPYENEERTIGESKWSLWKLVKYSFQGISSFSAMPLYLASSVGIISCVIAMMYLIYVLGKTIILGEPVAGYPTIVCLILFMGGVNLLCIGVLGFYLSKVYGEVKRRPPYLLKEEQ